MHEDKRRFSGRTVLVTGASKGIGRATAELLAEQGARVVAHGRSAADLAALAAEIGCRTLTGDLADAEAARGVGQQAQPVDLLVNCAGITSLQPFVETEVGAFDEVMAVNVRAAMIVAQETVRGWLAHGCGGAIVNVSSLASFIGIADHTAYCASKGALDAMTRAMACELGRHGIRVNSVNPTVTLTAMAQKAWSDPAKSEPMLSRIPLHRFVEPREVATAIAYLLSEDAAMVNGTSLPVDGGFRAI